MTRKDYVLIAKAINNFAYSTDNNQPVRPEQMENLVDGFALALSVTNPLFDEARFREACFKK